VIKDVGIVCEVRLEQIKMTIQIIIADPIPYPLAPGIVAQAALSALLLHETFHLDCS